MAGRASRNKFPSDAKRGPEAYVATRARIIKGEDQGSGRNSRFINKRTNGQISRFGLRMADFILSRLRSSSVAKSSHFYQGLARKAGQPQWPFYQSRRQFYQGRPAYGRFINNGRFIKVEDQASGRFLDRAGKASGRFIRPASRILLLLLAQLLRKLPIKLLM